MVLLVIEFLILLFDVVVIFIIILFGFMSVNVFFEISIGGLWLNNCVVVIIMLELVIVLCCVFCCFVFCLLVSFFV